MRRIRHQAVQRGMTLLETLVTLAIVAMVTGLLSEGLFQIARIEQRLGGAQLQAQVERLHVLWLQQALEGLLPGAQESPDRFKGESRSLSGISTQAPAPAALGPQAVRLELTFQTDTGMTDLRMSFGLPDASQQSTVLARWSGDRGAFAYQDSAGNWVPQWPPALGPAVDALPRSIAVNQGEQVLLVAVPQAAAQPLGRRVDRDRMP